MRTELIAKRAAGGRSAFLASLVLALTAPLAASAQTATIVPLPAAPDTYGTTFSALSADGSTTVGYEQIFAGGQFSYHAVRWNAAGQVQSLEDLGANNNGFRQALAYDVSWNGGVVVGYSNKYQGSTNLGTIPTSWDAQGEIAEYPNLANPRGAPFGHVNRVSADGSRAIGRSFIFNASGAVKGDAAVRFSSSSAQQLENAGGLDSAGIQRAYGLSLSWNGDIVGGYWEKYEAGASRGTRPIRWNGSGAAHELRILGTSNGYSDGRACVVSYDGQGAFGFCRKYDANGADLGKVAVHWNASDTIAELGVRMSDAQTAILCDSDGDAAAGECVDATGAARGFYWTPSSGPIDLGSLSAGPCFPKDLSEDGTTVVGRATPSDTRGGAFVWRNGEMKSLWSRMLAAGTDPATLGWTQLDEALACSADGSAIVGLGRRGATTVLFRVTLPINTPPTISTDLANLPVHVVPLGKSLSARFTGQDVDAGDELTLAASALPPSAVLAPIAGTKHASPFPVDLSFTAGLADVGTHVASVSFVDKATVAARKEFTIQVPANAVPTVTAPATLFAECQGDHNWIALAATVNDADAHHKLTVVWKIAGEVEQTETGVDPGETVFFEHDFPHGVTQATVEVRDAYEGFGTASTTVTVDDTTAPTLVVAEDVVVPTDAGKRFATNVVLTSPQVFDRCDGEPTLSNNAPAVYPLGDTVVTWTAIDNEANRSTGTQKVTVVDRERPTLVVGSDVTVGVDSGEIFATLELPEPMATDNVTEDVTIVGDAPAIYPIGETVVTWTAIDAAGNSVDESLTVTVVNENPLANAGANVALTTTSSAGAAATLDGSASSDADEQDLTYSWSAPGITFDDPNSPTPTAFFPVGTTTVTLVVADEAGATDSDEVTVSVTYHTPRVIDARPNGLAANSLVGPARSLTAAVAASERRNVAFALAATAAARAETFAANAAAVQFGAGADPQTQVALYKYWRSRQAVASAEAATLLLIGYAISNGRADDDAVALAFAYSLNAAAYGAADASAP